MVLASIPPAFDSSMLADLLTTWTVRVALALYVVSLCGQLLPSSRFARPWIRWCWITGSCIFLGHVVAAFAGKHQWSHAHAYRDTAQQTKDLIGWEFGGGIYFSYVFAVLWAMDAAWWCLSPKSYEKRPVWLHVLLHAYLFFIAFNGAIIFKSGVIRWTGVAVCLLVACALLQRFSLSVGRPAKELE